MDWLKITVEEFMNAYNAYPPNGWVRFIYKYFSLETEMKDIHVKKSLMISWIVLFFIGFISTILKLPNIIIGWSTLLLSIILGFMVIGGFIGVTMNNLRMRKIRKLLGVSKNDYNKIVNRYF